MSFDLLEADPLGYVFSMFEAEQQEISVEDLASLVNSLATIIINHADCVSSNDLDVANDAVELVAPLLI